MPEKIAIGKQDFATLIEGNYFYIDKTALIREWWESGDSVTLITRPRRFGKTLNMDMLNCFFSNKYEGREDLFCRFFIWRDPHYRALQGSYPVIFLSFADVKADNIEEAKQQIKSVIANLYEENRFLLDTGLLSENEKKYYRNITMYMSDVEAAGALRALCIYFQRYYHKKTIVLLDEYDTPMQEAYVHGYWDAFVSFIKMLFNSTFKTNPYLERAMLTGITRVSKESIFSDLNNPNVVTTTSEEYATAFGFTEPEVFEQLETFGLGEQKAQVKNWYDGFVFGSHRDIYNPWSITNYLDKKKLRPYWAATSSNALINKLIQNASADIKEKMERLLQQQEIVVNFDEQIVFNQLDQNENAIWSLLLASGYLKAEQVEYRGEMLQPWYHLRITNLETKGMFFNMFRDWFAGAAAEYHGLIRALTGHDLEALNYYMNKTMLAVFSFFDVAEKEPEKFYHGFVLGLLADQMEQYEIRSNRESGFGRYDIMMIPRQKENPAIVIEFKVKNKEKTLEETVQAALEQISEKNYDAELLDRGILPERIYHYGFAFEGKQVLIG